jgi:pSer/pThr/pTyr-binding forkhead associated (FHA) protein
MWSWLSRAFRSTGGAERAEAEGRFEDAVRLYVDAGSREEAVRVLLAVAETTRGLEARRALLTRAATLARDDAQRAEARRRLARLTVEEAEEDHPRTDDDRRALADAARALEALGEHADAARAYVVLEDREGIVRTLTLSGDVEALERLTGARDDVDRHGLRRRAATEDADTRWRSGDRPGSLAALRAWVGANADDHEARRLLDQRDASLLRGGRCELRLDGEAVSLMGRLPLVIGREGDLVLRGAGVSRRHCEIARASDPEGGYELRDLESRSGTRLDGLRIGAPMRLRDGQRVELGDDLALRVGLDDGGLTLLVERGLDRGRRVAVLAGSWRSPMGVLRVGESGLQLEPSEPVQLNGQRVAMPMVLAHGDRIDGPRGWMEVL